jgi:hypothetical protein
MQNKEIKVTEERKIYYQDGNEIQFIMLPVSHHVICECNEFSIDFSD